ncbi:unnamed protein product, partial [Laminaria digitata]
GYQTWVPISIYSWVPGYQTWFTRHTRVYPAVYPGITGYIQSIYPTKRTLGLFFVFWSRVGLCPIGSARRWLCTGSSHLHGHAKPCIIPVFCFWLQYAPSIIFFSLQYSLCTLFF